LKKVIVDIELRPAMQWSALLLRVGGSKVQVFPQKQIILACGVFDLPRHVQPNAAILR
jgi:hypothetical protein